MNRESEERSGNACREPQDWTKNCGGKQVDLAEFVRKMEILRGGGTVEWKCPFCGRRKEHHAAGGRKVCRLRVIFMIFWL